MQTQKPDNLKTLDNYWIYGPTGTGKSMSTRERFPSFYKKNGSSEWFTGYHGEDTVLWEEFSPYQIKYTELLKELGDHYPL
jgi:Cdc6-like AAA superfamily ATPase